MISPQTFLNRYFFFLQLIVITFLTVSFINAASGDVDTTFNPVPTKEISNFTDGKVKIQPDGKALIFGDFEVVNGIPVNKVARINPDGSVDTTFYCECFSIKISSIVIQPDGKIILAGFNVIGTFPQSKIIRLNTDGSLDNTFAPPFNESGGGVNNTAKVFSVQQDGKIYIARSSSMPFFSEDRVYRLNPDGSIDNSFNNFSVNLRNIGYFIGGIMPLPNGKAYIYGRTELGVLARLNADGTKDTTFETPALQYPSGGSQFQPNVRNIAIQSTGKILILGRFSIVNGVERVNFARLNTDGSLDLQFIPQVQYRIMNLPSGGIIKTLPNDQIIVASNDFEFNFPKIVKLNPDGTLDNTFNAPDNFEFVYNFEIDDLGRIYLFVEFANPNSSNHIGKFIRLNSDGSLDSSYNIEVGKNGIINGLAVQTNGKILMVGDFVKVNRIERNRIARINSDGSIDNSFDPGSGFNGAPKKVFVKSNGEILVIGEFTTYQEIARPKIALLNSDGSLNTNFNPVITDSIYALGIQGNGQILIGGNFSSVNGTNKNALARLNADGSLDASFNPLFGSASINTILVQDDGKILAGGSFTGVNGFNRKNLVRLNTDGSLDTSFNAGDIGGISKVIKSGDGKYLAISGNKVLKINADGTQDSSFNSPIVSDGDTSGSNLISLSTIVLLEDGSFVVGGNFMTVNGSILRKNIARFTSNGEFIAQSYQEGTNGQIFDIEKQSDGKIIIGGEFTMVEGVSRSSIARLFIPEIVNSTMFDFDGDGKADVSVFRPSQNRWYILRSSDQQVTQTNFAINGDVPVPADFDGDTVTDIAIYRKASGDWWSLSSRTGAQIFAHYGSTEDIPMPSDFDGDGRDDYIVYRPSQLKYLRASSATGQPSDKTFGLAGDKPVRGDFDGDGKSDLAIYRPSTGQWWYQSSINNSQIANKWGISTDLPVPADYDGDGITDFAVYRPANGGWYIFNSSTGQPTILGFGIAEDKPVPADYDGDGKADIAVFRPSTGIWYLLQSTNGFAGLQFGVSTDIPIPNVFVQE